MTNAAKKAYLIRAEKELAAAIMAEKAESMFENYSRVAYAMKCVREAKDMIGNNPYQHRFYV